MDPKKIVEAFVAAINGQHWAALESVIDPGFTRHSTAAGTPGVRSRADLIRFLKEEFATFPDAEETILDCIAEGGKIAVRHGFRGTQTGPMGPYPASGKVMIATYIAIYRVQDGKIVEAWAEWDNLAGLRQLGHV